MLTGKSVLNQFIARELSKSKWIQDILTTESIGSGTLLNIYCIYKVLSVYE